MAVQKLSKSIQIWQSYSPTRNARFMYLVYILHQVVCVHIEDDVCNFIVVAYTTVIYY